MLRSTIAAALFLSATRSLNPQNTPLITEVTSRQLPLIDFEPPNQDSAYSTKYTGFESQMQNNEEDLITLVQRIVSFVGAVLSIIPTAQGVADVSKRWSGRNMYFFGLFFDERATLLRGARTDIKSWRRRKEAALEELKKDVESNPPRYEMIMAKLSATDQKEVETHYSAIELAIRNNEPNFALRILNTIAPLMKPRSAPDVQLKKLLSLLNIADVEVTTDKELKNTAATLAVEKGHTQFVVRLLELIKPLLTSEHQDIRENAIKILFAQNANGYTILTMAAKYGNVNVVNAILDLARNEDGSRIPVVDKLILDLMALPTNDGKNSVFHQLAGSCKPPSRRGQVRNLATPENRLEIFFNLMEHLDRMKTMDLAIPQDSKNPPLRGSIPPDVEQPLNILKMKNKKERTAEDRALGKDPEQIKDEKDKNAEKAKSGCCSKMLSGCCCSKKKSDKSEADLAIEKTTAFEEKQAAALKIMAEALRKAKGVFKKAIAEKELEKLKAVTERIGAKLSSKEDELVPKQEEITKKEFEKLLADQKSLDAIVNSLTVQHEGDPDNKLLLAAQKKKNEIDDLVANAELEKLIAEQNKKLLVAESNTGSSSSSTETKIESSVFEQKAPVSAIKQEIIETVPGKEFSLESQVMVLKEDIKQLKINFSHANDAKKVGEAKVKHRSTKYPEAGKSLVEMKNDFEEKKRIERDERKESSALARYSMVAGKGNSPTDCLLTVREDAPPENMNRWVPSLSRSGR